MGKIGDPSAVDDLLAASKGSDLGAELSAIEALGAIGDSRARMPLLELAGNHSNPNVRYVSLVALQKCGIADIIDRIKELLGNETDPNVRGTIEGILKQARRS